MANVKVKNDLLRMADRKKQVKVEGGVLDGVVLSIRPPSGYEMRRTWDFQSNDNFAQSQVYLMSVCILSWNVTDESGEPVPLGEDTFSQIDDAIFGVLWEKLLPFVRERTPEELRFLLGSAGSSQEESQSLPNTSPDIQT